MRRRFEPIEPSLTILIGPMNPSACTCVPPQSSVDTGPASSTRTMSPYLSPKNAIAPMLSACGLRGLVVAHRRVGDHLLVGERLDAHQVVGGDRLVVGEVEAQPVRTRRRIRPASRAEPRTCAVPRGGGGSRCDCDGSRRAGRRRSRASTVSPSVISPSVTRMRCTVEPRRDRGLRVGDRAPCRSWRVDRARRRRPDHRTPRRRACGPRSGRRHPSRRRPAPPAHHRRAARAPARRRSCTPADR